MKKVKFVQLEPDAVLADTDFQIMTAEERGVYWTIILYLYSSAGKCKFEIKKLKKICNCENFKKVWKKISKKFQISNGYIKHKRVTRELRKARKFMQDKHRAGLKGAEKRWHADGTAIGSANGSDIANKRNVIVNKEKEKYRNRSRGRLDGETVRRLDGETVRRLDGETGNVYRPTVRNSDFNPAEKITDTISVFSSPSSPNTLRSSTQSTMAQRLLAFNKTLRSTIRPRNQSDRTAFRNIGAWLMQKINAGEFDTEIFKRVLDYADEVSKNRCRNPAAVFTSILKKELGYRK